MTIHIESKKEDIAPLVLMPGDPNRTKLIAEKYLENAKLVNTVRGELAYTGTYKGTRITVFSSGMGIASMGIYSYELFNDYDVDSIIRIGSCGCYTNDLNLYDIVVSDSAYSETNFDTESGIEDKEIINPSLELNGLIINTSFLKNIKVTPVRVHTTEAFYTENTDYQKYVDIGCKVVEMETYALLYNAKRFKKHATALLTVTDHKLSGEKLDSESREKKLDEMIFLALESIIKKEK